MKRALVLRAALLIGILVVHPPIASAQADIGAILGLYSAYVWRGISHTNKPVVQPDLYLSFPAGSAAVTLGGWANIDLGKYDDVDDDLSESGGLSGFNLSEFNPYAEVSFPAGKATLTGGAIVYIYPNDLEDAPNDASAMDSEFNTLELYSKISLDVLLSPELSLYYDVDKIKGAYFEGSISHSVPVGENLSLDLGVLAGLSAGHGVSDDPNESFNFADDGFTHLDLSAGLPLTAGPVSITPEFHLVIGFDDVVKMTSPTEESDAKIWLGAAMSWSRALEEEADAEAEAEAAAK